MRFKLVEKLNETGSTWLVRSEINDKLYVRKVILTEQKEYYAMLMFVQKNNQNIHIPQVVEIEFIDDEKSAIYERYIEGTAPDGACGEKKAIKYTNELLDILQVTHKVGIVHRDIKPSNIIIDKNDELWLIDFGIARTVKDDKKQDTMLLGTFGYAAPEQFGFGQSSTQTDIYSVGVLLNYFLTGKTIEEEVYSGRLAKVIKKCTEINPRDRYSNIDALRNAINGKTSKRWLWVVALVVALLLVGIAMAALHSSSKDKPLVDEPETTTQIASDSETVHEDKQYELKDREEIMVNNQLLYSYMMSSPESVIINVRADKLDDFFEYDGLNFEYFVKKNMEICFEVVFEYPGQVLSKDYYNYIAKHIHTLNLFVWCRESTYDFSIDVDSNSQLQEDLQPYIQILSDKLEDDREGMELKLPVGVTEIGNMSKISVSKIDGTSISGVYKTFFDKYCTENISEKEDSMIGYYGDREAADKAGYFSLYEKKDNEAKLISVGNMWSYFILPGDDRDATVEFHDLGKVESTIIIIKA